MGEVPLQIPLATHPVDYTSVFKSQPAQRKPTLSPFLVHIRSRYPAESGVPERFYPDKYV